MDQDNGYYEGDLQSILIHQIHFLKKKETEKIESIKVQTTNGRCQKIVKKKLI